jgi:hypothetical protein
MLGYTMKTKYTNDSFFFSSLTSGDWKPPKITSFSKKINYSLFGEFSPVKKKAGSDVSCDLFCLVGPMQVCRNLLRVHCHDDATD